MPPFNVIQEGLGGDPGRDSVTILPLNTYQKSVTNL